MELSTLRNFKMALSVNATGDASARAHARRRHSSSSSSASSSSSKSVSSASSVAGSPIGRFRDHEDEDDELRSERSNASSRSSGVAATAAAARDAQLNLPLDKEFVPLAHHDDEHDHDAAEREAMAARDDMRDDVIRMIFDLPDTTEFYQDFSCAIAATLAMHGRMYPTNTHVCFYSNVFGRERKILIPYESISEVAKTTTMVFQHAIRLATTAKDEYTFTSFWGANRDACYELIVKTRSRVLNELKPAGAYSLKVSTTKSRPPNSSSSSSSASVTSPVSTSAAVQQVETDDADTDAAQDDRSDDNAVDDERPASPLPVEQDGDEATLSSPSSPVRRASAVSDIGSVAPRDISMTEIVDETFGVSADDFMREFFWDGAPFGLDAFGATQGYSEMKVNPWMTPLEDDSSFGKTRSLQFRVPVDAPIGPKSSQVDVLQCAKTDERGRVHVIETSTRLVDIPYGDYFSVEDRWTLMPRDTTPPSCTLCIELKVVFSKSTFWKGKIETRAIADNKTKWCQWVEHAKQHLADKRTRAAAEDVASVTQQSNSEREKQQAVESSGHTRRPSHQLASQSSSASSRTLKRRSSRATLSHRSSRGSTQSTAAARGPSTSFILYLRVFPWILVLGLLFLVIRMQSSLANIEQTLVVTSAKMSAIERQLASLTAACPVTGV